MADFGLSSFQLDEPERGFSFARDGPLDMRFDPGESAPTAADLLVGLSENELASLFREHGDEPHARRIARAIVRRREEGRPVKRTADLAELVAAACPRPRPAAGRGARAARGRTRIHPATRVFQALRIGVNRELDSLGDFVRDAVETLTPSGRLAVISFHGGEDRLVKNALRDLSGRCTCPPHLLRCECGRVAKVKLLTKKPLRPRAEELDRNPRARSARLRVAENLAAG